VAIDSRTGAVLTMAAFSRKAIGAPPLNLSRAAGQTAEKFHESHGSIAKIVTASAAMENGVYNPDDPVICQGTQSRGRKWISDPVASLHRNDNDGEALASSCNPSFAQMPSKSAGNLSRYFGKFCFNTRRFSICYREKRCRGGGRAVPHS